MDTEVRLAAFNWLEQQCLLFDDVLPRKLLEKGLVFRGNQITLLGPKGIWKPKSLSLPLSIATISDGPYNDSFTESGFLKYKYRGTDPNHSDNVGLRTLMQKQIPLIYFHSIVKGKYLAAWPVYIQGDDSNNLTFTVALEAQDFIGKSKTTEVAEDQESYGRRSYLTSTIKTRLHQKSFREKVIAAYKSHCTLCRLRHSELLDAAHIIPDREKGGDPIVQNGLSLCKIHHAAFDNNIIGITPDYSIKVRRDILEEIDGPMLKYGIQSLNDTKLFLPHKKIEYPDPERLDQRYQEFIRAS